MRRAFSLIELLVVIAIIAVLVSMIMPALAGARDSAKGLKCSTQIRQIAIAHDLYADDHSGHFPPRAQPRWVALLDPYYEVPAVLLCPSDIDGNGRTPDNVETDRRQRSYFVNGFNDHHDEADDNLSGIAASNGKSMPRYAIWNPSDVSVWGEKRTESTHYYLDILEGVGNDFTELEPSRHADRISNYGFADVSVRPLRHPESLTPVNLWGTTDWGRASVGG